MSGVTSWIDLIWVPIAWFAVKGRHKIFSIFFVLLCVFMLRLQVMLMNAIGFEEGILRWIDTPVLLRGMVAYAVFIGVFLGLVRMSKEHNSYVLIAGSITMFTIAFCVSCAVMVL